MVEPTGYTALDLVGFTDKGTYSSSATYVKNDLVDYGGDKWQCMDDDVSNVTPTEGVYWHKWIDMPDISAKADITAIGTNETGVTASKAYEVGEHFYKNGKFCTAIANIASGATFTLNTNYVEGTIAETIKNMPSAISVIGDGVNMIYFSQHGNANTYEDIAQSGLGKTWNWKKINIKSTTQYLGYGGVCSQKKYDFNKYKRIDVEYEIVKSDATATNTWIAIAENPFSDLFGVQYYRESYNTLNEAKTYQFHKTLLLPKELNGEYAVYVVTNGKANGGDSITVKNIVIS